ncbi:MAG TPA: AAA-like domain-containing protein, partial [Allocoleopsis sp.]
EDYAKLPINESPFNVGLNVELPDFNLNLIKDLAKRYDQSENVADSLYQLLGGHPYLTHLALYNLAYQYLTLDDLLNYAATDEGIYRNHLHHYLMIVRENPDLKSALQQVINSDRPIILEKTIADKLKSLGLIKSEGNLYKISCQVYQQYFAFHLQQNTSNN